MALPSTTRKVSYTGNGSATAFTFGYRFLKSSDLVVKAGGVAKTEGVDYTVSGAGASSGGTVTFTTAPANGVAITIERTVSLTQETSFTTQGPYTAASEEDALDKTTMGLQQHEDRIAALEAGGGGGGTTSVAAVAFSAVPTTNQSLSDATETQVSIQSVSVDTAGSGAPSDIYTVPRAGKYLVACAVTLNLSGLASTVDSSGYLWARLYINSSYILFAANDIRGGTFLTVGGSRVVSCAQGDTIKLTATQHVADSVGAYSLTAQYTNISVAYLGT